MCRPLCGEGGVVRDPARPSRVGIGSILTPIVTPDQVNRRFVITPAATGVLKLLSTACVGSIGCVTIIGRHKCPSAPGLVAPSAKEGLSSADTTDGIIVARPIRGRANGGRPIRWV